MKRSTPLVVTAAGGQKLRPEQKRFNLLLARIDKARARLAQWQEQVPLFAQAYTARVEPLRDEMRRVRAEFLAELDAAHARGGLNKTETATLSELICDIAEAMIDSGLEEDEAGLKALFNRHSEVDFDTQQAEALDDMRDMLEEVGGIDLGDDELASEDDLMRRARERMRSRDAEQEQRSQQRSDDAVDRPRTQAQQRREREEKLATQSVREVYRKLASALHPDRATDAADQAEKTAYMQRVNQAYAAGDLLALMQLQLEIEQVDRSQITDAPPERVRRFNKLLAEQLEEIEEEIVAREMHLCMHYGLVQEWRLDPMRLNNVIVEQVQEFEVGLFKINRDRAVLGDKVRFKRWLKLVRRERQDDFF